MIRPDQAWEWYYTLDRKALGLAERWLGRMNVRDLPLSDCLLDGRESVLSLSSGLQVTSSHAAVLLRYTGPQRQSMSLSSHPFPVISYVAQIC